MLRVRGSAATTSCDGLTRRTFLQVGASSALGVGLPALLHAEAQRRRARSVIVLFLSGGPSHLDMWDLKPDAPEEIRGTFRPIDTTLPGLRVCEHLPRTAAVARELAVVRSVSHATGNHPAAAYWMMVGSPMTRPAPQVVTLSREDRPHPGAVVAKLLPRDPRLPAFALIPEAISPVGPERPGQHAGFLGAAFDPYRVNSDPNRPDFSPGALHVSADLDPTRLGDRRDLLRSLGDAARALDASSRAIDPYYARAFDLLASPAAQQAFDLTRETSATRDRYGRHIFGQSTLLARRLVEAGTRLVQVNWVRHDNGSGGQGYDSHRDHLAWCRSELFPPTDAAFGSLIEDLRDRGLLDETLVVMMGEFGRTPRFNANGGRDHWPNCFSVVLAGGGLRRGVVLGASDRIGAYATTSPTSPQDLHATLYAQLGLDPHALIHDQQQRPFPLVDGTPIAALTA